MLLKFVYISIFCIFCLFEHTQLPTVAAVPFEYNEDHEQYPYDLDTEQSQAKYDTRLLSQQLQPEEQKSSEESIEDSEGHYQTERIVHNEEENEMKKAEYESYTDDDNDLQPHERAASCYTREHKYTHGQKVPRLDPCEVCLCMDGEIFCWWEKCEKRKSQNLNSKNPKHTSKLHHSKKVQMKSEPLAAVPPPTSQSKERVEFHNAGNQHTSKLLKKQLYQQNTQNQLKQKAKELQQQQEQYYTKHQHQEQQQQSQKQLKKSHMHDKHFLSSTPTLSSSKIMNFPENLPSVLYYDYHTEEHKHHQHQHHQQHLKHQLQKQIQKMQREQQKRQQKSKLLINDSTSLLTTPTVTPPIHAHRNNNGFNRNSVSSSAMFAYDDLQTDSDILPEPPTKKPKILLPAISSLSIPTNKLTTPARNATTNERQKSNLYDKFADPIGRNEWNIGNGGEVHRLFIGETLATSSIFATDDVVEINKNVNENPQKISTLLTYNAKENVAGNNSNNDEEKDDAFHRWLTSTEKYNDNNNSHKNNNEKINYDNKNHNDSDNNDENLLPLGTENSYATESSEFENPFGIQNSTKNQQNININNNKDNKNNTSNNRSNKLLYPKEQERAENAENGFLHGVFNNDYSDYNGSVVNIDILLTTQDELSQQKHSNFEKQAKTEQLPRTPASIMFAAGLILNRNGTKQTAKTINDTKINAAEIGELTPEGSIKLSSIQSKATTKAMKVNVSTTITKTTAPTSYVQFIKQNSKNLEEGIGTTTGTPTSTLNSERHCNVMGTLYKIGEILPQDTGNCLQCICIDGSTSDYTPRVTCSPHNCPPLVLPDLFDATGY